MSRLLSFYDNGNNNLINGESIGLATDLKDIDIPVPEDLISDRGSEMMMNSLYFKSERRESNVFGHQFFAQEDQNEGYD